MRGAHRHQSVHERHHGIIPADAGSTLRLGKATGVYQDHPRGCGEHSISANVLKTSLGSSPRMRGAPCRINVGGLQIGIIPADAGSTKPYAHALPSFQDHPRGCGEHS